MEDSQLQGMKMAACIFSIMIRVVFFILFQVSHVSALQRVVLIFSGLVSPVRAVAFSPGGKLLAAAGDSKTIALYDAFTGEQVANLNGHGAWILSIDWSDTGEFVLSG